MKRWWQLCALAPAIMVAGAAINFGLCFKPLDWLAFRGWEVAIPEHPTAIGPFEPNRAIHIKRGYGDLAAIGNIRDMRQYREEEFSVDEFGFRNASNPHSLNPAGFVVGDSFTAGAGISDADTLPAQLTADANEFFYNAGALTASLTAAEAASSILHLTSGTVVYQLLERSARQAPPLVSELTADYHPRPDSAGAVNQTGLMYDVHRAAQLFVSDHSPTIIVSEKFVKNLQDGFWIPNTYGKGAVRGKLRNGDDILFYPEDFSTVGDIDQLSSAWSSYLTAFQRRMKEQNLTLVVLLVPNKATVYGPLTVMRNTEFPGDALLERLEAKLRTAGVPVLNLTPVFRAAAARELPQHEYLYWRDDTHWNPRGVRLAADALWDAIRTTQADSATSPMPLADGPVDGNRAKNKKKKNGAAHSNVFAYDGGRPD